MGKRFLAPIDLRTAQAKLTPCIPNEIQRLLAAMATNKKSRVSLG